MRGFSYKQRGDFDRAIADFDEAIRISPKYAAAYSNRGDAYRQKGDLDRAIADLDQALFLDPRITPAYVSRGLVHEKNSNLEKAGADFNTALARPPIKAITTKTALETAKEHLAALDSSRQAEVRVAMVIGNSAYKAVGELPNPKHDAQAMATALRRLGFNTVLLETDLGRDKLVEAVRIFAGEAEKADWAVVYYAGHGIEMNGTNYLVPIDAKLETDRDVQFEALPLDQLLSAVEGAKKLRLILLDACRDNPFARQMRRTIASRSIGRGLASIEPDGGTLVAYAAKHGEIALDGESGNSPFVAALVRHLATPGVEISKFFRLVRDDVLAATNRKQEPFVYGSLPGEDFFFKPPEKK